MQIIITCVIAATVGEVPSPTAWLSLVSRQQFQQVELTRDRLYGSRMLRYALHYVLQDFGMFRLLDVQKVVL